MQFVHRLVRFLLIRFKQSFYVTCLKCMIVFSKLSHHPVNFIGIVFCIVIF